MRIGAGVLHYRAWPEVCTTLDALLTQTRVPETALVVDNGSDDGSAERIREAYPQVDVVELPRNLGPSGGTNRVLEALLDRGVEGALLLTHDCRLAPDALERLVGRLETDPSLGAVGPVLGYTSDPDRIWSAGGEIHSRNWDTGHPRLAESVSAARAQPPYQVAWLDGAALLLRADAARQTGRLHEAFFYFFDEADYQLRMGRLGWRTECVPQAVAWQEPGSLSPYIFVRNRLGFLARNAPRRFVVRELIRVLFYLVRDTVRPRSGVDRSDVWLRLRGLVDFLRGRWGRPPTSVEAQRTTE